MSCNLRINQTLRSGRKQRTECSPLHIPPLCAAKPENTCLGEHVERHRVDSLLVNYDKVFGLLAAAHSGVAHSIFERDDLPHLLVYEPALRFNEFLPLFCRRVEET
jgi:hypothetical protein